MTRGDKLSWGSYGGETPIIIPINKDGEPKMVGGRPLQVDLQDVVQVKLQESIDQFCVFGKIIIKDRGKFRMAHLMREGYDYLRLELYSNRDTGGYYGDSYKLDMEILNISSQESGRLVNSVYDFHEITVAQYPAYRNLLVWKISKGYSDIKISAIVDDLFENFLNKPLRSYSKFNKSSGEPTIEATADILESFCNPFWSPYKTINYLKRYARTASNKAGFHCWFDLKNQFNFRSLESIMNEGDLHDIELRDIVVTNIEEAQEDTQKIVKDYYPDFVHKEFYKIGVCGASAERFNWFKKKGFVLKQGYLNRPVKEVNKIFEKEADMNNMFGFHISTGYRGEQDGKLCQALVYNQMLTGIAAQGQNRIIINGITGDKKMKSGDTVKIENRVQGINENVEELRGRWFVRGVSHTWNTKGMPYRQTLALSRIGEFDK
jgi:hypothetical protein